MCAKARTDAEEKNLLNPAKLPHLLAVNDLRVALTRASHAEGFRLTEWLDEFSFRIIINMFERGSSFSDDVHWDDLFRVMTECSFRTTSCGTMGQFLFITFHMMIMWTYYFPFRPRICGTNSSVLGYADYVGQKVPW